MAMAIVNADRRLSRRDRAARTKARIIEAAYSLFTQHGYEATTMQAVADEAGVAVQTVYFTFRTKAGLLAAIESRAVGSGEEGPDWLEQRRRELLGERNASNVVALWVAATAAVLNRITAFVALLGASLPMDTDAIALRDRERDRWFQTLIDRVAALGSLRPDLTHSRALDVARALVRVEAYQEMTRRWQWTDQEWIEWMTGVLTRELLDAPGR